MEEYAKTVSGFFMDRWKESMPATLPPGASLTFLVGGYDEEELGAGRCRTATLSGTARTSIMVMFTRGLVAAKRTRGALGMDCASFPTSALGSGSEGRPIMGVTKRVDAPGCAAAADRGGPRNAPVYPGGRLASAPMRTEGGETWPAHSGA